MLIKADEETYEGSVEGFCKEQQAIKERKISNKLKEVKSNSDHRIIQS